MTVEIILEQIFKFVPSTLHLIFLMPFEFVEYHGYALEALDTDLCILQISHD